MESSRKFKLWHLTMALGIAAIGLLDALYFRSTERSLRETLHEAGTITVLLLVIELMLIVITEHWDLMQYTQRIADRNGTGIARFEATAELEGGLLAELGKEAMERFLRTYSFHPSWYGIKGEEESIRAYLVFWEYLLKKQGLFVPAIKVFAVHSLDIAIWSTELMREVRNKQRKFLQNGGELEVVFVAPPEGADDGMYAEVIEELRQSGRAEVLFSRRRSSLGDFVVAASQRSIHTLVKWTASSARRIIESEYRSDLNEREIQVYREQWAAIASPNLTIRADRLLEAYREQRAGNGAAEP